MSFIKEVLGKNKKIKKNKLFLGYLLLTISIFSVISMISYLFTYHHDYKSIMNMGDTKILTKNIMGKLGAYFGHMLLGGFGIASFILIGFIFSKGIKLVFNKKILSFRWIDLLFYIFLFITFFGFFNQSLPFLGGFVGYGINTKLSLYAGKIGTIIFILFMLFGFLLLRYDITIIELKEIFKKEKSIFKLLKRVLRQRKEILSEKIEDVPQNNSSDVKEEYNSFEMKINEEEKLSVKNNCTKDNINMNISIPKEENISNTPLEAINAFGEKENTGMDVVKPNEDLLTEKQAVGIVKEQELYDPKLDLSQYKYPYLDLLEERKETININREELEENKNQIVETLRNYKIEIVSIKATVGPTITLYEIVPAPGIRISKIQNLENDIALSLSALGIRIIAPIPGKGTIGIEVPNSNPSIVSMKNVLLSKKFQENKMDLPIALGKTISNETYVTDLAKMPHLLMAGATGQGKSVGLNAILTSLLYKKHPAEVKFVLVDPKKVELTLFNKIERHFLAKLPGEEDAIITDTTKVVNTLNSLCLEMDERYELLKNAFVRNIKEYNEKFISRKLNPNEGHRYLPYIVLVIDEFADLIMTAGKEVELPIARLAQLARAIGIHLIIATQRPSVNVITGIIKANFPARIAFRVTSKIDSRTILDASGADQLIGRGDMLVSSGNDLIRVQCAFVDTPEVESITDFIGSQQAYPNALLLPEYIPEGGEGIISMEDEEKDSMFNDAARLVVATQQGSTSLIQRKLKLGYNRAGRLIDQLEAYGIVGPFEGSKARQVLVQDENTLERMLNGEI